jgi:hypothetical protein
MPPAVEHLQSTLTYQFTNPRHLLEALRAAGSGYNIYQSRTVIDGNKAADCSVTVVISAVHARQVWSFYPRKWWGRGVDGLDKVDS